MATKNPRNEQAIKQFGINVRKLRNEKGLTILQLAVSCDVEIQTISRIERGTVNCTVSTIIAIVKALDFPVERLFEEIV